MSVITINDQLAIPEGELLISASRSSGPGGQNVNKVNSRVSIELDVAGSPTLSDEQRVRIMERLASRISREGVLRVSSQKYRTQAANREDAIARFASLLAGALAEEKPRKKTKVPRAARAARLESKRQNSLRKRQRAEGKLVIQ